MWEPKALTSFFRLFFYYLSKGWSVLTICGCVLLLSACMPLGNQEINLDIFKDKEDMKERVATLRTGMSKQEAFDTLGIAAEKFARMSTADVQMNIYGNSVVQGSPEQLEQFRQRLMGYEGYSIAYRNIHRKGSLGFGTMTVNRAGHDLRMVLIFDRNRLMRAAVDGNEEVNEDNDEYLWSTVLRKTTGIGF